MGLDGSRLRKLRESRGLYPQQVADYLGISRPGYLKYENGETKHPRKIDELARFFNVTTDYLLGNDVPADTTAPLNELNINSDALVKQLEKDGISLDGRPLNKEDATRLRDMIKFAIEQAKKSQY